MTDQMEIFAAEGMASFDAAVLAELAAITEGYQPCHHGVSAAEIAERLPPGKRVQVSCVSESLARLFDSRQARYSSAHGGMWWPKRKWERDFENDCRAENAIRENAGR